MVFETRAVPRFGNYAAFHSGIVEKVIGLFEIAAAAGMEVEIGCRPDATGRGIGKLLYGSLFESIVNQDINRIVAGIAQPNFASNALHHHFGFQVIGTFSAVGRKFGRYWDVLWMERPLKLP
jgi:phosphinothricin acetyltransferase